MAWADILVVMEKAHRSKVQQHFRSALRGQRLICLDKPDDYAFMEPTLIELLRDRLSRYLP